MAERRPDSRRLDRSQRRRDSDLSKTEERQYQQGKIYDEVLLHKI